METPADVTSDPASEDPSAWLRGYRPPEGFFDEWKSASNTTAAHWKTVMGGFESWGQDETHQRDQQIRHIIRDNGITYNNFAESTSEQRPWTMDMVPLLLDHGEWQQLEVALSQRMHLLNLMLQDLYGRQNLLNGGKYPPQLVYGNPAFLRPCHNMLPTKQRFIHLYTADLARSPDGNWWVLSDRLDAASGLGYAIENRLISTRVLPEIFRATGVMGLQPFLNTFTSAINRIVPSRRENPLTVLLTPGPFNETYFEQAFLARNLGYPLVEGGDLTVRDNLVYLKTTNGMRQVDVILRRVDSDYCDPLELRGDSLLGVPGLLNAVRLGNVSMINAPGCGLLETPATLAFLPGICKSLLGENLRIPSVATWWCGQPGERQYVLDNLAGLVIKPTFRTPTNWRAAFGPSLDKAQLAELRDRILANPQAYTAQEVVAQATTPCYYEQALYPRHFLMRVFMVLPQGESYTLMPGGLGRIAAEAPTYDLSMQQGGQSKDVWVAGHKASSKEEYISITRQPRRIRRSTENLPSRVADSLFWLGRYVERTECLTRYLLVLLRQVQETATDDAIGALLPFLECMAPRSVIEAATKDTSSHQATVEAAVRALVWDEATPSSLVANVHNIKRTTETVKERISGNTSHLLRDLPGLRQQLSRPSGSPFDENLYGILLGLIDTLAAFSGMVTENTVRGQDWYFLDIGRRLERGLSVIDALWETVASKRDNESQLLGMLLDFADSTITYRRRYLSYLDAAPVCDLILLDPGNPRSLAFQVEAIRNNLEHLPHTSESQNQHPIDRCSLALYSRIWLADVDALVEVDASAHRLHLKAFLDNTGELLREFSNLLSKQYFSITAKT